MIEKITAQSGQTVLRFNGRLLASTFSPVEEAEAWLQRRQILLHEVKTAFVLGAGSGYHIVALAQSFAGRIVVIDRSQDLVTEVKKIHAYKSGKVQFEIFDKAQALRNSDIVRDAVKNSYVVLTHPATAACDSEFFAECEKALLARDWGALNWQWQLKGHGCLDSETRIGGDDKLTIYDLEKTELVQDSQTRERMLIKALRELVK